MKQAPDPVWESIHAALDARRDPLDDARLAARLAEDPEIAREYAELAHGLDADGLRTERRVPTPSVAGTRRSGRPPIARLTFAAAILLVLAAWLLHDRGDRARDDVASDVDRALLPDAPMSPTGAIERYRIEREHRGPTESASAVLADGRRTCVTDRRHVSDAVASTIQRTTHGPESQEHR